MAKFMNKKNPNFIRIIEERALSKKEAKDRKKQDEPLVPYLPKDCISNILVRLRIESLRSSRFVCKPWYNIIDSPVFVEAHLGRCESVLIFLTSADRGRSHPYSLASIPPEQPNTLSVESSLGSRPSSIFGDPMLCNSSKSYIRFMEFKDGKGIIGKYSISCLGTIRAACNGLILLDNKLKKGGLILMNPATRKLIALPIGTIFPSYDESYGFARCNATGEYKVVHLFRDKLRFVGCETLNIGSRFWRPVDGPTFGLFRWFGYAPVSAIGALHWIPHIDRSDHIVSMEVDNEKFLTIPLPKGCRTYDRIIEMGGSLCFVTHEMLNIDLWILKGLHGEVWTKHYSITAGSLIDMVPLFSLRIGGDMIFRREEDHSFYSYDFELRVMTKVEMEIEKGQRPDFGSYLPHVNSLVSWNKSRDLCD